MGSRPTDRRAGFFPTIPNVFLLAVLESRPTDDERQYPGSIVDMVTCREDKVFRDLH
jgi:hypothetical protein